ncbi:MAG: CBASS cGAMP-activated phospholipase [Aliarcobacter sp.]|nr:CBASS cGAMP-activated phospholipase [Aliarcobacter sp.]
MEKKIKVLSLDGGGVRGYLSAKILKNLEEILNKERNENINIGQRFDLIVGTSTGGIIASALSIGKSAKEIFELYETLIPDVFKPISNGTFEPKYSNKILKENLERILENNTLATVITNLCITSVDVENSSPRFHKSGYFGRNTTRLDEKLVDLALATSAAPTYFPLINTKHSTNLTDGGMVANNPSLVGLIDAMQINNHSLNGITLISIGTGEQCHMPYDIDSLKNGGKIDWILDIEKHTKIAQVKDNIIKGYSKWKICKDYIFSKEEKFSSKGSPILELLMDSQSKLAHFQTQFLLQDNYLRINPKLSISIELDSIDKIDSLKNLADLSQPDLNKINKLI